MQCLTLNSWHVCITYLLLAFLIVMQLQSDILFHYWALFFHKDCLHFFLTTRCASTRMYLCKQLKELQPPQCNGLKSHSCKKNTLRISTLAFVSNLNESFISPLGMGKFSSLFYVFYKYIHTNVYNIHFLVDLIHSIAYSRHSSYRSHC